MKLRVVGNVNVDHDFEINIYEGYKEALTGLDGFGHIIIIWWANQVDEKELRDIKIIKKPYKTGPERIGIFATRSPQRFNPICISVIDVKSIDYDSGIIYTSYIDAENGTPILDIKPYYPCSDVAREAELPKWCKGLPKCIEDSDKFDWSEFFNF